MLPVTFLSDYGLQDEYVGVCHGVIRQIAPEAPIIDITHGIPARDVRAGAMTLRRALPFMPQSVHLAIVDPGVGTVRRPLALRCENGALFVGPDNGLLWPAAEYSGGVAVAVDLTESAHLPEHVSATFHGRDLFAPIAAQLATHLPVESAGTSIDPAGLVKQELPLASATEGHISVQVVTVDSFGNLSLNAGPGELEQAGLAGETKLRIHTSAGSREIALGHTFGDVERGKPVLYPDSSGSLAIAVNEGDAAAMFGIGPGDELALDRVQ